MATAVPVEFMRAERRRVYSLVPVAAVLAVAAAGASLGFALAARSPDPVQVFLMEWVAVPYVTAGVIAWWRRPASRLGPLMVAGGLASAFSGWQLAESAGPYTFGAAFDIVPAALFIHVCLAFPDGRLRSKFEGALVGVAYASAVGLQFVKLALGGVDPANLVDVWRQPDLVAMVEDVQLLSLSACCVLALAVLMRRRQRLGRPRRRAIAFVIDSFALALVMIAALFVMAAFDWPGFREVQRVTLFVVGLSPLAFLLGLLDARLARSSVGDLMVALRSEPAPPDLRDALAHTLRDPSLTLAYWLPDFNTYVDVDGRPVKLPDDDRRTATLIDRNGEHVAALMHDPVLDDEHQLLEAVGAAAGMSLENARLQAELRARVEELRGSRARVIEAGQKERQRLERDLHDGAQQRLIALSLRLSLLERRLAGAPEARLELDAARDRAFAGGASGRGARHPPRGAQRARPRGRRGVAGGTGAAAGSPGARRRRAASRTGRGHRLLRRLGKPGEHREACTRPRGQDLARAASGTPRRRGGGRRCGGRGHRTRLGAAWPRRPGRGAGRAPPGLDAARWRDAGPGGDPVRVAIAEDSVLLREGLARLLDDAGIEVVAQSADADDLLLKVRSYSPDVAIVDIRLPPTHNDEGLRAALEIRSKHPDVAVLVLSQYVELGLALTLLADSAEGVGYLLKDRISDVDEFVAALRRVADGGSALDPIIVSTLVSRERADDPLSQLTPREREVLELMAAGSSNQGIADSLVITVRAVEKYVSSIFTKLGLPSTGSESRRVLAVLTFLRS
jgi:DNA-binding NarL/FixJ family response regulator/signal transduction histidine kinase